MIASASSIPGLALISSSGQPAATERAISGFSHLVEEWRVDPVACATTSFEHPPTGAGSVLVDPEQARILQAVARSDRVAVRTGRGVGKTAAAALIVHWWLSTRNPALVVTSAGSWGHLEDKLWPEIQQWGRQWILREGYEYQVMGIYNKNNPQGQRAEATSSDTAVNVEGFHSPHLLILIDEAKGMPDEIFDALIASLTGNEAEGLEQKIVVLSSPPLSRQGWFARVSSGTEWDVVHISGLDSPRVSRKYIEEIAQSYGEDSAQYQSYVLGNIPEAVTETVVPLAWFEACQQLEPAKKTTRLPVLTCDVAREGDDLSTFGVLDKAAFDLVQFPDGCTGWTAKKSLMEVVARCCQAVALYPNACAICIDDTGLGGGVTDRLRELQHEHKFPKSCSIVAVKFGAKPIRDDRFKQKKDELWWASREVIREEKLALPTDEVIRGWRCPRGSDFKLQLTSALYEYDSSDRIDVLDKRVSGREKTKSLPTKSPDLAHALILGLRYYMRQGRAEAEAAEPAKTSEEALGRVLSQTVKQIINPPYRSPYQRRR